MEAATTSAAIIEAVTIGEAATRAAVTNESAATRAAVITVVALFGFLYY